MQLPNRLSQLFQKETDKLLKGFLDENPDLLKKYVNGGLTAVSAVLTPVNVFMRHLLVVQGLDPDTTPGEKQRVLLNQAMDAVFEKFHEKDFEDDYDVSWVRNKFGAVQNKLNITKDRFMALTDLSKLESSKPEPITMKRDELIQSMNPLPLEADKRELPIGVTVDEVGVKTYSQNAIQKLQAMAEQLKLEMREEKKSGIKTSKKKVNKKSGPGAKVSRVPGKIDPEAGPSTLTVQADRKNHEPSTKGPGRSLADMAAAKKAAEKATKESTPEFKAEATSKLTRATALTHLMASKGLIEDSNAARDNQIESMKNWSENNFEALERVVKKYNPTKDAVAENKFKGSFRRIDR